MKNINIILILILLTMGCKEDGFSPISKDTTKPNPIIEPIVENLPGAAKISYTLPEDKNLLYVKAVYTRKGETVEAKASLYNNYVIVEGFGDTQVREVELFTVSRAEVISSPVKVTVNPLPPAIYDVLQSLEVIESFGGLAGKFQNSTKANIVIGILKYEPSNAEEDWINLDNHYTGLESGTFTLRGQDAVLQKYGFFVRDRWRNHSDTLIVELTPIYEEEIDGSKITYERGKYPIPQIPPLPISGDPLAEPGNLGSWPFPRLFDGLFGNTGFHSNERNNLPAWFAMDLKVTAKLSRYRVWQRNNGSTCGYCYSHGNPHEWEIWGTNTPTDVNSWVLLDYRIMVKPSGLPIGQISNEDKEVADAGHEYEFSIDNPAVRYVAWKHIDNWGAIEGATGFLHMAELKFWGQIQE